MVENVQPMAAPVGDGAGVELKEAERLKFFTDAVVAIAITLLILPLMESVNGAARGHVSTSAFVHDHSGQLFSFALSFAVIWNMWTGHERLYQHVARYNALLMVLNAAWMLTIVFLPVPTAMIGSMDEDALQKVLYIGTMLANSVIMLGMQLVVGRTPALRSIGRPIGTVGITAYLALVTLYTTALVLSLSIPGLNYYAMFALFLTRPLEGVYARLLPRRGSVER